MNRTRTTNLLFSAILILGFLSSCRALSPPESCGVGSYANPTAFDLYFTDASLLDVDGNPGELDRDGAPRFNEDKAINLWLQVKSDVRVRVCVEETRGGGEIAFDETRPLVGGQTAIALGGLDRGPYVVRLSIDGTLVQNIPFSVR